MKTLRSMLIVLSMSATTAFADIDPGPPPDFKDCTAEKQKKSPTDECQECNNIYQDGCEKQLKNKGLTRACQIKPKNSREWREVWCKAPTKAEPPPPPTSVPAAPTASETVKKPEPPAASAPTAKIEAAKDAPKPADTKTGGCAVDPSADAGLLLGLVGLGLVLRRRRSGS